MKQAGYGSICLLLKSSYSESATKILKITHTVLTFIMQASTLASIEAILVDLNSSHLSHNNKPKVITQHFFILESKPEMDKKFP